MAGGILDGVRVIDLAEGLAGSVSAMQLAEAGAEVVKVEPPAGAPGRGAPGFAVWNRGKKSVVLDVRTAPGRLALAPLLASADVLVHEFTPAQALALELDDTTLARRYPGLIVSAVAGWPRNHANADRADSETLVLARLGILAEQPGHRPGPVFVRMPFARFSAAWLSAIGVVARLIQRGRGRGVGPAHTSLAQGGLVPMTAHWARAERPSASFARGLDKNVAIAIHRCSDGGYIHVHYAPDAAPFMKQALEAMGPEHVAAANARWGRNHTAPNFGANREIFATRPVGEWLEHLWAHDVAAQPAAAFGRIHFDAQARLNGYIAEVRDPLFGDTLQPGAPYAVTPPASVDARGLRPLGADDELLRSPAPMPATIPPGEAESLPLSGVRVLDFGAYLAGPFGAMLLADLGADVIKIEPPGGDFLRYLDRTFCSCQRGKRSVALQLKDPRARPALEALVRWADCFHHNMRLPSARKLGLDYEDLAAVNPRIVGCHVSSYGPTGSRADWPGFDQMFQASCGWEVENGGTGNPPLWLRFGICDHFAGFASAFALLLGLYHRDRTGQGQMTNASLLGAAILTTSETLVHPDGSLEPFAHLDQDQAGVSVGHRLYRTAEDGWIAVAALTVEQMACLVGVAGNDPRPWLAARTAAAAEAALTQAGVPAAAVREDQMQAFLDDPDNRAAGLVARQAHLTQGRLEQVGAYWTLGNAPPPGVAAPTIGQHSREVLAEVGLTEDEIEALGAAGVAVLGGGEAVAARHVG